MFLLYMSTIIMDFVSPVLNVATRLWDCTRNHTGYIRHLEENLDTLRDAIKELKNINEDVKRKVELAEEQQLQRTNEVDGWLEKVEALEKEVNEILQKGSEELQKKCLGGCCPMNYRSSYKLGKVLMRRLESVRELANTGHFTVVADRLPAAAAAARVDERPMEMTVGLDSVFAEAWRCLEDQSLGIVGLYGMGGVGKTTLLKKINNKFLHSNHNFNVVIWVLVSKEANLEKIQEVILKKLQVPDGFWMHKSEEDRAAEIFKILKTKKFVLFLDDLWKRLDLIKVGIPKPDNENGSKIVFTTRSEEVCRHMEAQRTIKVECLPPKVAMELFRSKVGEEVLNSHPEIPKLAEIVVKECKGLPLALITIGRAMASRRDPREWKHAVKVLQSSPSEFSGIGDQVFSLLKFSYDSLDDDTVRMCFLYCCIFPEDYGILKDELIELWIGEGFFGEMDTIYDARNQGEYIIGTLKLACLLETGESGNQDTEDDEADKYLRMHDVIRDMALWIARENGKKESKILVLEHVRLIQGESFAKWKEAERASLWGPSFGYVREPPDSSSLQADYDSSSLLTLLVRGTKLKTFPSAYFQYMPALKVLNLMGNGSLTKLPAGIGFLVNLCYLNLSLTFIQELPVDVKKLQKLKILLLDDTDVLRIIPKGVISSLSSLQVFSRVLFQASLCFIKEDLLLQELESLENISDISITLFSLPCIKNFFGSPKLQRCMKRASLACSPLNYITFTTSYMRKMEHLEKLELKRCDNLKDLKIYADEKEEMKGFGIAAGPEPGYFHSLCHLEIDFCPMLLNLRWVIYFPCLQILQVSYCNSIVEIIGDGNDKSGAAEEANNVFSHLTDLYLNGLPNLKSICPRALAFPSLKEISVFYCPNLRVLPFHANSARNSLKKIEGHKEWWDGLQWENEAIKDAFSPKFILYGSIEP